MPGMLEEKRSVPRDYQSLLVRFTTPPFEEN